MAGPRGGIGRTEPVWARVRGPVAPTNRLGGQPVYPGTGPWQLPPIPPGYYNPALDIQLSEGKLGTEQTIGGLNRQKTNAEQELGIGQSQVQQREADQLQKEKETLGLLGESYKKLGVAQGDRANATGTLYGGALISAAMKRAANEGRQRATDEAARAEQKQANEAELGRLSAGFNRTNEGLIEALTNAGKSQQLFGQNINTLKGEQAAKAGYTPEQAGGVVPYERSTRGGFVRVGMPR